MYFLAVGILHFQENDTEPGIKKLLRKIYSAIINTPGVPIPKS